MPRSDPHNHPVDRSGVISAKVNVIIRTASLFAKQTTTDLRSENAWLSRVTRDGRGRFRRTEAPRSLI